MVKKSAASPTNKKTTKGGGGGAFYAWSATADEVVSHFKTTLTKGLTANQVEEQRKLHGFNELEHEEGKSFWELVLEQFEDPLVRVLLLAATISTAIATYEAYETNATITVSTYVEPLVIILILALNAAIGVYQESSAEASLEALKDLQPNVCHVLRDGEWHSDFPSKELVPGDVIRVQPGDSIPADARMAKLLSTTLRSEQMALTGESVAVLKQTEEIAAQEDCEVQMKVNMLFSGTTVSSGSALCVVVHTGMKTEIGKIQDQIKQAAEATAEEKTPLQRKLDEFSDQLQWLISAVCVVVWVINIRNFVFFDSSSMIGIRIDIKKAIFYFQIAVALAVAAIPEGLPTVISMCLALGTRKMAARNCIVRQLPSVETLGCTTVICSDKTGTLTTNQMSVRRAITSSNVKIEVQGSSYDPKDGSASVVSNGSDSALESLLAVCAVCNDADVVLTDGKMKHVGAPTEAALKVFVEKASGKKASGKKHSVLLTACESLQEKFARITTLEFTRDRKSMGVLVNDGKKNKLFVKGAPESVLERCSQIMEADGKLRKMTEADRVKISKEIEQMSTMAWRCLACAVKTDNLKDLENMNENSPIPKVLKDPDNFVKLEIDLTYVGVVGMQDPPREEVKEAIENCRRAGIRVMVITGDNKITAEAIAKEIGVFDSEESDLTRKSFIGSEFTKLSVEQRRELLWESQSLVFSRAEPKFKQDIVTLLKQGRNGDGVDGEIVAMTGDGVNDAPALKMADIGIAMGITGTEVAKGASDMVLADDNFSTIVAAIEEGRSIYSNMKAFIRYMISSNIGEVASIFFTAALGFPEGMISVQLLWVNLVTDGPPATALGFNQAEPNVMSRPPRKSNDPLIGRWATIRFLVIGLYVGVATVGIFAAWFTNTQFLGIDLSQDGHSAVTLEQLMNWDKCNVTSNQFVLPSGTIPSFSAKGWNDKYSNCQIFGRYGKMKASTLSLTVLVVIEMMNACNALSEDSSLLRVTPLSNFYLIAAICFSMSLHFVILYIPSLSVYFDVVALNWNEWKLVLLFSFPVVLIDETLKLVSRTWAYGKDDHSYHAKVGSNKKQEVKKKNSNGKKTKSKSPAN